MINEKVAVPLSPPTSPHMSDTDAKLNEFQWQHAQDALSESTVFLEESTIAIEQPVDGLQTLEQSLDKPSEGPVGNPIEAQEQPRPLLRSHKSFPYSLGPSSRAQIDPFSVDDNDNGLGDFKEHVVSQGPQPNANSALPNPSFGGSAPTSPVGRLTPNSPNADPNEVEMEDEDFDLDPAEQDEEAGRPPRTAAELRAQKRKMKRFRLTHNQTRFLMSEFARQAHPDAAHRERLSREIPGLSPRQVQVWFQNRRAKLKRLTTDDRESMMRSRALPMGFDMTQALHAPFGATTPTGPTPSVSPQTFTGFAGNTGPGPLTLDTMRRPSHPQSYAQQYTSPTGVTPAIGNFAFTPPQSATETLSPASVLGNASAFNFQSSNDPKRYPYGMSSGSQSAYVGHSAHVPRLHTHQRFPRPMGEAVGSPLRTSISYSGLNAGLQTQVQAQAERANSFSEQSSYTHERVRQSRSATNSSLGSSGPYGLGFSYAHMPGYHATGQTQRSPSEASTHLPSTLDQYRRNGTPIAATTPSSYTQYPSSTFATPQMPPQYTYYNPVYGTQPAYSLCQPPMPDRQPSNDQFQEGVAQQSHDEYAPMVSESHQFGGLLGSSGQPQEPSDGGERGMPVHTTF